MEKKIGIHLFRRDLRIEDNTNLRALSESVDIIIPVFILSKKQILTNKLRNDNFVQFLLESLEDLDQRLENNLVILNDFSQTDEEIQSWKILIDLFKKHNVSYLSFMQDYTLYSRLRDGKILKISEENRVKTVNLEDTMLHPISENIRTDTGNIYKKFTPYYTKVRSEYAKNLVPKLKGDISARDRESILEKIRLSSSLIEKKSKIDEIRDLIQTKIDFSPIISEERKKGKRSEALAIISDILAKKFNKYNKERDYPAKAKTTKIGAYLKMGLVSVRELAKAVLRTENEALFRELIWRDFYYYIAYHFDYVLLPLTEKNLGGKRNFDKSDPNWKSDSPKLRENLERWKNGETGFPIVDAGMRQLNLTGWMHNRLRMIVASFLIKDLGINWQEGEIYFAQKLIDYDPSQNNGGWQWSNGTGVDSQPYNRIFNPWEQAKKWDPEAEYIKKWVPELSFYPTEIIHNWDKVHEKMIAAKESSGKKKYISPIVDHKEAREEYLDSFR